ncbi:MULTISPECIES: alpha/beta fold hydrolase [Acinetobacter]|jgi:triacylglycerol lipase|uniref:alpha/beta fold hydrolase n=1 Tax=Acinetobacter TaxID=469 RepID=UPI00057500FA|nr:MULTISPECIES: alpha/beta hydrolase [Acinetobacter]ATZ64688.1 alpha/beta hydrolase [Acinetobacter bereziniae]MBI0396262.1 alpha/beta hydrolase [Acinetobacter bereziniae]MCU4539003.1 alpha/beta hydrolase [Acinetobacter bereziniae]MDR3029109.1 alpha/beta hydrolase [Acinetobacter sp.]MDV8155446.1 alpha/beta hydrolase [Acinetobacter bereziniae]
MKGIFNKLLLSTALVMGTVTSLGLSNTYAAPSIDIQSVLQQERAWAGMETKRVKVGDIDWAYSEGGPAGKPTLMLVHGLAGSRDNWNRVARYLTPYYHVIIPDLPGQGDSKVPNDFDYSLPNLTEKLRRFAEAIKVENGLNVAGHSMGGSISLLYAAQYPVDTKSLFLIDSAGVFKSANTPYLKDPTTLRNMIVSKPGDFDRLMKIATNLPPFIPKELKDSQEKLMISQSANTTKLVEQLIVMSKLFTPDSFAIAARSIDQPVLIAWGDKDQIINVEAAAELKGLLKNAQEPVILKGVGHLPLLEQEQLLIKPYLDFLAKNAK